MRSRHGEEEEKEKTFRAVERRAGWNSLERRSLVSRGCGVGFRTRTPEKSDMPRTLQLVTEYPEASPLVPNRPWRAEPPCVAFPAGNERGASTEPYPLSGSDVLAGTLPRRR
ncbi:hypothetical protein MTO96_046093 [Rhipicephalus appendiculatus]